MASVVEAVVFAVALAAVAVESAAERTTAVDAEDDNVAEVEVMVD